MATRRPAKKANRSPKRGARASETKAKRLRRERRAIGSNVNYQYWIAGYMDRQAAKTGKLPTAQSVRRDKQFQKYVDVVLAHDPKRKHGANSRLAKALVELGIRDPSFRGAVGNSPKAIARARGNALGRRGRSSRMAPP